MQSKSIIDEPKLLRDHAIRESRRLQLSEQHIAPLADFVRKLRRKVPDGIIPDFDPWDGGIGAEVLFLLEAPGPKAGVSGFVSRNNPDETAKNFFELNAAADIPRKRTLIWNAVPWYIGSETKIRAANCSDLKAGIGPLFELLKLLPNLRALVLIGRKAEFILPDISRQRPDLKVFKAPHPSPMYCNRAPENRQNILRVLKEVARFLHSFGRQ